MIKQCAAVGLATPNHRGRHLIHVCLTPTSDYASQQHDERTDEPRLALLASGQHLPIITALFCCLGRTTPVRLRFPSGGICKMRTALRCAVHHAACDAGAHRYSQSVFQSAAVLSDRESCMCTSAHRTCRARADLGRGDNECAASKNGQYALV